jgi:HAD superfamily hydrolase (TIGR01549 family)
MDSRDVERIRRRLPRCRVFSVDVFDTALLRLTQTPRDVFRLVEDAYRLAHPEAEPFEFATARIDAERRARNVALKEGREEVTLEEIYAQMAMPRSWMRNILGLRELEIERAISAANPCIRELVDEARRIGKRVVFISDMYLPAPFIADLLHDAGYAPDGALWVSSEHGVSKSSGRLFDRAIATLGVRGDEILHIGDNPWSDVEQPRRRGMNAELIERPEERAKRRYPTAAAAGVGAAVARGLTTRSLFANGAPDDFWYHFGVRQASLFFGFADWLRQRLTEDGFDHVYFLSRDGHIMRRVFEVVAAEGTISTSYLYASRRAFNIPALTELDARALRFLSTGSPGMRVRHYLERLCLDPDRHIDTVLACGFPSLDSIVGADRGSTQRLISLFSRLEAAILTRAADEREALVAYLSQEGVLDRDRIAVVDLGWHGTLQESLTKALRLAGRETRVFGYYLGTFEGARGREDRGHPMRSFLFHHGRPVDLAEAVTACVEIYEFLHVAPHGTVVHFEQLPTGTVVPVLAPHEAPTRQLASAARMQEAALDGVRDLMELKHRLPSLQIGPYEAVADLRRVLIEPTREEAIHLGDVVHADAFGDPLLTNPLAQPPSLPTIVRSPRAAWNGYYASFWKEGYVTRLVGRDPRLRALLGGGLRWMQRTAWVRELARRMWPDE